jgi:RND family efflux transporter MFP subunit
MKTFLCSGNMQTSSHRFKKPFVKHFFMFTVFACGFIIALSACKDDKLKTLDKKKKQLAEAKNQLKELQLNIERLEKEIAQSDTSFRAEQKVKLIKVDTVRLSEFKHFIEVQGTVDADENVLAINQIPGIVTAIYVQPGDRVTKGQVLATTDGSAYERAIEGIQTGLDLANTAFEKQKRLWEQNIGSEIQYLQAKTQKETLEKQLKAQMAQLEMTKIKSPINGRVDEVRLKLGDMAAPSQAMPGIRIINTNKLTLKAKLSDVYIGKVRQGDWVQVYFPDLNKTIETKISYAGQVVNPTSRTFNVEAKLDNVQGEFAANMIAKLLINDEVLKNVMVVPSNLIQRSAEGMYVLIAQQEKGKTIARKRMVKTGSEYNGQTVITEGLQPGDRIITFGYSDLVDGQLVDF